MPHPLLEGSVTGLQPAVGCSEGEHLQPRGGSAAEGKDGGELSMQTDVSWIMDACRRESVRGRN